MLIVLLLAFHANFAKKQTYQVSPVTYCLGFAHVLISFLLKCKNYFRFAQDIYSLFHTENVYRTCFLW